MNCSAESWNWSRPTPGIARRTGVSARAALSGARMYLTAGFRQAEEQGPSWWGREVIEERYDLAL